VSYDLSRLASDVLARNLVRCAAHDRETTALLLAYIAEFDARHLYLPAGFPSMFAYCVEQLGLSEEAAYVRISVARTARAFPAFFPAIADGRLHLTAVRLLAPHLTEENHVDLIAAAAHLKKVEIEVLLASRFPQPEPLRLDEGIAALPVSQVHRVGLDPDPVQPETPAVVRPIAPQRFSLQVTLDGATHAKLRRAQDLLSHAIPSRDVAEVLDRALDALIEDLEKRKFAKTTQPRSPRESTRPRRLPAHVKRAVYQRDAGRCAFRSADGRRCGQTERLEFDHVVPVARGGRATVDNTRLLCRAHNQDAADEVFGRDFMSGKRGG
jgi:hypothetical protein